MNVPPEKVKRYLEKYSSSSWKLEGKFKNNIENVIIVPVICEFDNIPHLLASLINNDNKYFLKTAVVFVVNNLPASPQDVKADNLKTLNFLRSIIYQSSPKTELTAETRDSKLNIFLIDAASNGLELSTKEGGVGLARKLGMDAALTLFDYNSPSKKILISLDADCTVEKNYLTTIVEEYNTKKLDAGYVKFQHNLDDSSPQTSAIICYEIFLHYYVLGLKYAGSPYAFHTIGSTIICDYESYIKVEGMNKRKAAEDFYFLEKLAKSFKIKIMNTTAVFPSSRNSWRVPFGTGQRVTRFLKHEQDEYLLYDPVCFDILKKWLAYFHSADFDMSSNPLDFVQQIHIDLANFLKEQQFKSSWKSILQNSNTQAQLNKQKHKWFDGFRTLKLIHYLRDKSFPQINMFSALNGLFKRLEIEKTFFWYGNDIPDLETQKKYLRFLRELAFTDYTS